MYAVAAGLARQSRPAGRGDIWRDERSPMQNRDSGEPLCVTHVICLR
jgi:hypothetical protein